jgi:predicted transposase/invertase (TIGR01784 family)
MKESVIYQEIFQEGKAQGILQGMAKGIAEGKAKFTRKVALNLLKTGMNLETISEITELPLAEIQALEKSTTVN